MIESFPKEKPKYKPDPNGWFSADNKKVFGSILKNSNCKTIVELGAWLGKSTRWFLTQPTTEVVYTIDTWKGSKEHEGLEILTHLYGKFLVNCWDYQDRLFHIKNTTLLGLDFLKESNVEPDLIFIDASHEYNDVLNDLEKASTLFPKAILTGDDWNWKNWDEGKKKTVKLAVQHFASKHKFGIYASKTAWVILK